MRAQRKQCGQRLRKIHSQLNDKKLFINKIQSEKVQNKYSIFKKVNFDSKSFISESEKYKSIHGMTLFTKLSNLREKRNVKKMEIDPYLSTSCKLTYII